MSFNKYLLLAIGVMLCTSISAPLYAVCQAHIDQSAIDAKKAEMREQKAAAASQSRQEAWKIVKGASSNTDTISTGQEGTGDVDVHCTDAGDHLVCDVYICPPDINQNCTYCECVGNWPDMTCTCT